MLISLVVTGVFMCYIPEKPQKRLYGLKNRKNVYTVLNA